MTTALKVPGGDDQNPGGNSDDQNKDDSSSQTPAKGTVAYETYKKAVDEAKAAKAKVAEFEKSKREAEESKLKQDGEYKKLLEQREQELKETQEKLSGTEKKISESRKLNAFLGAVPGDVPKQYWGLIDLDGIAVDPETGMPDPASVKKAAAEFEKSHPEVVKKPNKGKLPTDAANGSGAPTGFSAEIKAAKTQKELDLVLAKYGKI